MNVALGYLNINEQGKKYVNDCLDSNRLSRGKYTTKLEQEFSKWHGCKHGLFCNSGTSALQIALAAMKEHYGWSDGDEVLVPAITFVATANVVIQNNLKPVFVDVDPLTFNMDPNCIALAVTDKTQAIIPVHMLGLPANMPRIMSIAHYYGLKVLEDSCETMFAGINGQPVGSFGDMACFSTYVAHLIVGGVGGLVTTKNTRLDELCKCLMNHGRDTNYITIDDDDDVSEERLKTIIRSRYKFDRVGYSYRCTELEAALALSEFECWEKNIAQRRNNALLLSEQLKKHISKLQLPYVPEGYEHSYMMYPLVLDSSVDRDALLLFLEKRGIETRYLFPMLNQPVYTNLYGRRPADCPAARVIEQNGILLGIHQGITDEAIQYVADAFSAYFQG